jgi:molecular chaperone GrpE (heat shock protein)
MIHVKRIIDNGTGIGYSRISNNNGVNMTQQEVMEALDKAGIDYNFIEEFDGSMHIIVKFEEEVPTND